MATLPLDPTDKFYDLIENNSKVFPTRDEAAITKEKITQNKLVVAIQHLTEIIKDQ